MEQILAISPLDGRYAGELGNLAAVVSEFGLMKYRVKVEIEWLKLLFATPQMGLPTLGHDELKLLDAIVDKFDINQCKQIKEIESLTKHDVKAVEYYIKEQIAHNEILHENREFVHFAATSEDINNLSYGLMIKDLRDCILPEVLDKVINTINELAVRYRDMPLMSRTHGQPATPTTVGKELYNVVYRLQRQLRQLRHQEILGKFNGAVGNYNAHVAAYPQINWPEVALWLVEERLGLTFNPFTTQIEPHDYLAEFFDNVRRINTILIDFTRDIWGYISLDYFKQKMIVGEVGSSTMPHKVNPINFENSEGNLGVANALAVHLSEKLPISRYQRDLSDSTVLRNIGVVIAHSVLAYQSLLKGLDKLEINQAAMNMDLDNHWELLAEPIQTVMRKAKIYDAYEQLKQFTRGKKIHGVEVRAFIENLDLPLDDKDLLLSLTPDTYTGLASKLY